MTATATDLLELENRVKLLEERSGVSPYASSLGDSLVQRVSNKYDMDGNPIVGISGGFPATTGAMIAGINNAWTSISTSSLYWDNTNSRLGLGTNSPTQNLSVQGFLNVDQGGVDAGAEGSGNYHGITFGSGSGEGIGSKRTSGGNQYGLDFYTGYYNRLCITNGGDVGIGRSPGVKFDVAGTIRAVNGGLEILRDATAADEQIRNYNTTNGGWRIINSTAGRWYLGEVGNTGAHTRWIMEQTTRGASDMTFHGSVFCSAGAGITTNAFRVNADRSPSTAARTDQIYIDGASDQAKKFYIGVCTNTTDYASIAYLHEGSHWGPLALQAEGGNVGIGKTGPGYLLDMESSGGGYYSSSDHQWHNGSSSRWKENISNINSGLNIIRQLRPVEFKWKKKITKEFDKETGVELDVEVGGNKGIGFIAEEIGSVIPEAVGWSKDEPGKADGFGTTALLAYIVKSIQELSSKSYADKSAWA